MHSKIQKLKWPLLIAFLGIHCTRLDRKPRTQLTVDGQGQTAIDHQEGCGGGFSTQTHRQLGGGVAIQHETKTGWTVGGHARLLRGHLVDSAYERGNDSDEHVPAPFGPAGRQDYFIGSLGFHGGLDGKNAGFEGGLTVVTLMPPLKDTLQRGALVPWVRWKQGWLESTWFELTVGPPDPLFMTSYLTLGSGWRRPAFRGRMGVALYSRFLDDLGQIDPSLEAGSSSNDPDLGIYGDLEWIPLDQQLGVTVGGVLGDTSGFRLGVVRRF